MPSYSKKQIFEFLLLYMVHSPIFPPASQAHENWKNQRMSTYLPQQPGIHILMPMSSMKNQCLIGRET